MPFPRSSAPLAHGLEPLSPAARHTLEAAVVLGNAATVDNIAELIDATPSTVEAAADAMLELGLVKPGWPLRLEHPLVASTVHRMIPADRRQQAHERAAWLPRKPAHPSAAWLTTSPRPPPRATPDGRRRSPTRRGRPRPRATLVRPMGSSAGRSPSHPRPGPASTCCWRWPTSRPACAIRRWWTGSTRRSGSAPTPLRWAAPRSACCGTPSAPALHRGADAMDAARSQLDDDQHELSLHLALAADVFDPHLDTRELAVDEADLDAAGPTGRMWRMRRPAPTPTR